jgi:hypothetical protein
MEAHISHTYVSYVIDPQVYGLDPSIWKTVSGTPSVASNKYRLNAAEMLTYSQYRFGEFEFNMTVPAAPTAADNRVIGLVSKSFGNRGRIIFNFDTTGVLLAQVYDRYGNSLFSETIPWNAAWTNTPALYRIGWSGNAIVFTVSLPTGASLYTTTYQAGGNPLRLPMTVDVANANADNLDVTSVAILHTAPGSPVNSGSSITNITPGTGATSLGKAEDSPHASGDVGVEMLAVRTDTPASSGANGDYVTVNSDSLGHLWNREGFVDQGVDNTNGVFAFCIKPLSNSTYSLTTFSNWGANTTLNVKATPGNVFSLYAYNTNAAARFEQLHNTATTPSASAVPVFSFLVGISLDKLIGSDFFGPNGYNFSTGIAFAHSSAFGIYTAGTAADGNRTIQYK